MNKLVLILLSLCAFASAQQPPSTPSEQIEAMKQCSFLVGKWEGNGWMTMGVRRVTFKQSEIVASKLNGLVLQIDGLGMNSDHKVVHEASATVAYDPQTKTFRFRSYEGHGYYLDTDATCHDNTFIWNMNAGPRKIRYTITLNDKKQWFEAGETSIDGNNWQKIFEMTLDKKK